MRVVPLHDGGSPYWILFCPPSGGTIHGTCAATPGVASRGGIQRLRVRLPRFRPEFRHPVRAGLYEDAITAYRHLTEELGVPPQRIILAGRSLGSAVAWISPRAFLRVDCSCLSAIDSVPARAARFYPWAPVAWLASLQFDSLAKAPRIRFRFVHVHSPEDWLVPLESHARCSRDFPDAR